MAWLTPADVQGWASNVETAAAQPTPMGYPSLPQPSPPAPPPPQPTTLQMDCVSTEKGRPYHVVLAGDRVTLYGQTRTTTYPVYDQHAASKEAGAWVAAGPSRYGQYGAVFGGPNPRMAFVDNKGRTALDLCRF